MEASGYKEKAPQNVQEEDMRKLTSFFEQLEIISEAEKKLDAKTGNNWPRNLWCDFEDAHLLKFISNFLHGYLNHTWMPRYSFLYFVAWRVYSQHYTFVVLVVQSSVWKYFLWCWFFLPAPLRHQNHGPRAFIMSLFVLLCFMFMSECACMQGVCWIILLVRYVYIHEFLIIKCTS